MNMEELKRQGYEFWCKKLQQHLNLKDMPNIEEYKDEIGYNGEYYKKTDL